MEKQLKSDIEVEVTFKGVPMELLPDFRFDFYTELHKNRTYVCSKEGAKLTNCTVDEREIGVKTNTVVKCMLERHRFKTGRLCVLAYIKWLDEDYKDGVRDDVYRERLDLIIRN